MSSPHDLASDYKRGADGRPVPAVPVLEPTDGAWVNDNTWGDQFSGAMPQSEGSIVQVMKNNRLYGPPAVHTINLFRSDERLSDNADIHARVTYGAGGVQNEFFCDWNQGVQFDLVANVVTIAAVTYAPQRIPYDAAGGAIFFGAMFGKGSTGKGAPLTYTLPVVNVANGGGRKFDVPDFAVAVRIYMIVNNNPQVATNVTVTTEIEGVVFSAFDLQIGAGGQDMPLPGAVRQVGIGNASGTSQNLVVQWVLGL